MEINSFIKTIQYIFDKIIINTSNVDESSKYIDP